MSDPNPKYLEVSRAIEAQIRKGKWDGQKMPGVRGLAQLHGVSVVTASRALQVLKDRGLIRTVERSGNFRVAAPTADRWAVVLRPTPGPWHPATLGLARCGFEALARRDPMHLEHDLFPISPTSAEPDVRMMTLRAKAAGVRRVFLL